MCYNYEINHCLWVLLMVYLAIQRSNDLCAKNRNSRHKTQTKNLNMKIIFSF